MSSPPESRFFSLLARKALGLSLRAARWGLVKSIKSGRLEDFHPALSRFLAASSLARPRLPPQADAALALAYRSRRSHPELLQSLLSAGIHPDARLDHGSTLLHDASAANDALPAETLFVTLLLQAGADPNLVDGRGLSALSIAAARLNPRFAELLLRHGANPNAVDSLGETPLIHATPKVFSGLPMSNPDSALLYSLLLNAGADPNIAPHEKRLPLILALGARQETLAYDLIRFGARIEPLINPQNHLMGFPLERFYPKALAEQERFRLEKTLPGPIAIPERSASKPRFL